MNASVFAALIVAVPLAIFIIIDLLVESEEEREKREEAEKPVIIIPD